MGVSESGEVLERVWYDPYGHPTIEVPVPQIEQTDADGSTVEVVLSRPVVLSSTVASLAAAFTITAVATGNPVPIQAASVTSPSGAAPCSTVELTVSGLNSGSTYEVRIEDGALLGLWEAGSNAVSFVHGTAQVHSTVPAFNKRSLYGNRVLFQSHLYDYDSGLYLARARAFDPYTGMFLQQDPAGYADSANLYAGFKHDPINLRDPTGAETGLQGALRLQDSVERQRTYEAQYGPRNAFWGPFSWMSMLAAPVLAVHGIGAGLTAGAGAYTGLLGGMELSAGIAGGLSAATIAATGDLRGADSALAALAPAATPAALLGTVGLMPFLENPEQAMVYGPIAGGSAELLFGLARGAAAARARRLDCEECTNLCFVAGTPIAVAEGSERIERLKVGDRVTTFGGGSATKVDESWRVAMLQMPNPVADKDDLRLELLRPPKWFEAHAALGAGDRIFIELEELEVSGWATVIGVRDGPKVRDGAGRVVLGTVTHLNSDVYELTFEGGDTLRPTGAHPLYSLDRDSWVAVRDLRVGERLQTAEGAISIAALERVRGTHRVFNLEVEGDREYFAGSGRVRAHNNYAQGRESDGPRNWTRLARDARRYLRDIEVQTGLKVHRSQFPHLKRALRERRYTQLTTAETRRHRNRFNRVKDDLITEWEQNTGQVWPRYSAPVLSRRGTAYREVGDPYDAHHLIENSWEGPHEWWNMHPARTPDQHQGGIHRAGGVASEIF